MFKKEIAFIMILNQGLWLGFPVESMNPELIYGICVDVHFPSERGSMFFQILKGVYDLKKSKNAWSWSKCVSWDLFNTLLLETNQGPTEGSL